MGAHLVVFGIWLWWRRVFPDTNGVVATSARAPTRAAEMIKAVHRQQRMVDARGPRRRNVGGTAAEGLTGGPRVRRVESDRALSVDWRLG
jgi:hypothetical protein